MINNLHQNAVIGIKHLSPADLGISRSSNQTHIGLFEETLNFIKDSHLSIASQLVYENCDYDLLSIIDYISNPNGTVRSPKIRKGNDNELYINNIEMNSIVRKIREIVKENSTRQNWFLLWFGLDTNELVFFLFNENYEDFNEINSIVGNIGTRKTVDKESAYFNNLVLYLSKRLEKVNFEYLEELEIASQTENEVITKRIIPRIRDIEKANRLFKETGKKGEELINSYLELEHKKKNIKGFTWVNKSYETGLPYDFEITTNENETYFSDSKATSYKFEQPIIISSGEMDFIKENKDKYLIHRVYSITKTPKLKICNNIARVNESYTSCYNQFKDCLTSGGIYIKSLKIAIPTTLEILNYSHEINL